MQFQFDARTVEPGAGFEIWPVGDYPLVITAVEPKPIKTGEGAGGVRIVFTVTAIDGSHKGKVNYIGLNIQHPNPQTVEISHRHLSAICWVTGNPIIQNLQQVFGKPFVAQATISERGNNWQNFRDMQGVGALELHKRGATGQPAGPQPGQPAWGAAPQPPTQPAWGQPAAPAAPAAPAWGQSPAAAPPAAAPAWSQPGAAPPTQPAWGAQPPANPATPATPAQPAWGAPLAGQPAPGAPTWSPAAPPQPPQWGR